MTIRLVTASLAAIICAGLMAHADPPHSRPGDLPPGLAKQGKIPPGHACVLSSPDVPTTGDTFIILSVPLAQ